ncbi:MAG: glycosyltransferase family 2 protein, partial [Planctomycetota bacterium]
HGIYWKYEEFLRVKESDIGYLPFVSGAFYAIRKELYTTVPENMPDDSVSPLGVYKQGYTVIYAKDSLAYEVGAKDAGDEFKIKTRGIVRELSSIFLFKELVNPFKNPALSFVLISHRLLRWSVPLFLIALFLANLNILENSFFRVFFWMQISFYLLAVCGLQIKRNIRIISLPFYFCLVNMAALWGIILFLCGKKLATWKPVR